MAAQDFITQLLQVGVGGVDLKRAIDAVNPLRVARMTNFARDEEGRIQVRPGQRRHAWGTGGSVHSMARLQAALAGGEYTRFFGMGPTLQAGNEGQLVELADGFSGLPLTMVPGHPPLSGDSWLYVADSAKMVQVRGSDRLVLPIGMAPPEAAVVAVVGSDNQTAIDPFDATGWTNSAGTGGAPSNASSTDKKQGAASVAFTSAAGSAAAAYYNFWGKAAAIDLSRLTGVTGFVDSGDDDQFHLWLKIDKPGSVDEIRLYFVVSDNFSASVLPGTSTSANTDAYVKSFIPGMFTPLVEAGGANAAIADALTTRLMEEALEAEVARQSGAAIAVAQQSETRAVASRRLSLGRGQWTEFGAVGTPLRRGEFLRIGSDTTRDWGTVTGLVVMLKVNDGTTVVLNLDDLYMRGGFNPDTSSPTAVAYDYRYRHYDPRTGAKSRWSPVMEDEDYIDVVRQSVRLMPEAYGDSAVRQQFARRGGTLPSDWYYIGQNHSDGGCAKDNVRDSVAVAAGADSDVNYHQPVTTVDVDGNAVYAQPIPVVFGPAPGAGILLGLGDPYRPGHVYWTLPDQYNHWPLDNYTEVCSPDEELMNGGIFAGQAFCLSRDRMYGLLISVVDNRVRPQATSCAKGLAARWGVCVGLDAIYFVATDGIWKTTGGTPMNVTDDYIEPLFRGQVKSGYAPVDFAAESKIRLWMYRNELWFAFQDTSGDMQTWVYSLIFQFWRHYDFANEVTCGLGEEGDQPILLLGSALQGRVYSHEGTHDDGLAIAANVRTGALSQGTPRQNKLYGDLEMQADLKGVVAQVTVHYNLESGVLETKLVQPLVGPSVYLIDAFGSTPLQAKDVSIDIALSAFGTSPWIGHAGPSFVPQPESSVGRLTDWDTLGGAGNKIVKGILIDADTFGYAKTVNVVVDGGTTPATSFTIQTTGRQYKHISFDSQVEARSVRLVPADDAPWIPYEVRWMFDVDPLELTRWETQDTDNGIPVEQTLLYAYVTLRSSADVTLTVTARRQDGTTLVGTVTIAATAGAKTKKYVLLPVLKGLLFKYLFTSASAFRLFREESVVAVQPWGAEAPVSVQPFGTDNLDVARLLRDAEGAAGRGERWLDMSAKAPAQGK